ncbi:PLP-dependent aminotransferase family protein [Dokdonella soli]|uniref:PLP-dependent aminotransferase family protein n=1 Tax=Dokdonella soli TaxID=529810 RepID=A0ABN1IC70_9GAMM
MRSLHEQLRAAILDQRLRPGSELPSTRRVAVAYGIARNTVIAAYDLLAAEGYVATRVGAKAVVADLGTRSVKAARQSPRPQDDRLNPQWRLPAWTTMNFSAEARTPGFQLGTPEHRYFPFDIWRRLLARAFNPRFPDAFGYQDPHGRPRLRSAIAQHVSFARAVACSADDVVVTSGAQQAFDLLARVLVTPGRTKVAVEDPGYPLLRTAMAAAGALLVPVPVDEEGLCVDQLPSDVRIIYVTPSHQFPTGAAMSMPRRMALLAFARRHGAVIIEDDYDGEFRYGNRPLDALQTLDRDACVLYVGTFSKSLFPSLRVGYVVAPAWAHEALLAAKQCADTTGNVQVQDALGHFILEGHLARHVRKMRNVYATRREAMLDGLTQELRTWFRPIPSEAGIHLSARYRDAEAAQRILSKVRQHAPGAQPIGNFAMSNDQAMGIVFGIGCIEADAIRDALRKLSASLER